MNEKDRRRVVADFAHRAVEIVGAVPTPRVRQLRQQVAETDQPEGPPMLGQSHRLIFEQRNAGRGERPANAARAVRGIGRNRRRPPVVIAENGVDAERRLETRQLLGPGAGRHIARNERMGADIVAEQHREIRLLGVGEIDDVADALFRHPGIAGVNVGDDRDLELEVFAANWEAGARIRRA